MPITQTTYCQNYTVPYAQSVWLNWNAQWYAQATTTTNAYSFTPVWNRWVQQVYVTTPVSSTVETWQTWINQTYYSGLQQPYLGLPETEEQRLERRRREDERVERRRVALVKARTLLESVLSEEQRKELEHHGRFHVVGSRGRRYCIRAQGQSGNVSLVDRRGNEMARLCAHPREHLPDPDAWLHQLLSLTSDEDEFLRTANVHSGRLPDDLFVRA